MRKRGRVYAVILVGGKGKRLRPLSTNKRPKAFLSITKDRKTMFKKTVDRIKNLVPAKNILVVANRSHSGLVRRDFPDIQKANLLLEPVSRNTAPAITFAASMLEARTQDAVMVVLPADQYIENEAPYLKAIKEGIAFARDNSEALLVLAVKPRYPATEFGYIRVKGHPLRGGSARPSGRLRTGSRVKGIYKVSKFTEKPDLQKAKTFLKDGGYLWNAGAFIFNVATILRCVAKLAPGIYSVFKELDRVERNYKMLPDISIDYAVMEKADNIHCVRGSYGWRDAGSFIDLKEILRSESRSFVERGDKIVKIL